MRPFQISIVQTTCALLKAPEAKPLITAIEYKKCMFGDCGVSVTDNPIKNTKTIEHKCLSRALNRNPLKREPVVYDIQTIGKISDIFSMDVFIITLRSMRDEAYI